MDASARRPDAGERRGAAGQDTLAWAHAGAKRAVRGVLRQGSGCGAPAGVLRPEPPGAVDRTARPFAPNGGRPRASAVAQLIEFGAQVPHFLFEPLESQAVD